MATVKETIPFQSSETLGREQNSFVVFIDQKRGFFERHSSSTYELRDERDGWRNSSTIDEVASSSAVLSLPISRRNASPPSTKEWRQRIKKVRGIIDIEIFGSPDGKINLTAKQAPLGLILSNTTPEQRTAMEELAGRVKELQADFREAIAPLTAEVEKSKVELFSIFRNYLLSDPDGIFAFRDFLSDKKYAPDREAIKPFLASFIQSEDRSAKEGKIGILAETVNKWTGKISERITPSLLDEFVMSIRSRSPDIFEWLEFVAYIPIKALDSIGERDRDLIRDNITSFLNSRPDVSAWPQGLKRALSSFVTSKYAAARSVIEKELDGFRRPPVSKPVPQIHLEAEGKRKRLAGREEIKEEKDNVEETSEKAEKKYQVGILIKEVGSLFSIRVLTEDELTGYLQKEADSFAASDSRMMRDLKNIVTSLRKDPYGLGTKKLKVRHATVGHISFPLRSINPRRRIDFSFDHPDAPEMRVVYVIFKNEDGSPAIGIEGIYRYEDHVSKFGP